MCDSVTLDELLMESDVLIVWASETDHVVEFVSCAMLRVIGKLDVLSVTDSEVVRVAVGGGVCVKVTVGVTVAMVMLSGNASIHMLPSRFEALSA